MTIRNFLAYLFFGLLSGIGLIIIIGYTLVAYAFWLFGW